MNRTLNTLVFALLVPLVAIRADDLGLEARYWKALHEGRDTAPMAAVLEGLAFPERRSEPIEQLRQEALEQLKLVEASAPLTPIMNRGPANAGQSGGGLAHLGWNRDARGGDCRAWPADR